MTTNKSVQVMGGYQAMSDNNDHGTQDYEHVWPPYGVQIAEPDTRMADEIAALRGDLVMALATLQEINRRLAVVEHRMRLLEAAEVTA